MNSEYHCEKESRFRMYIFKFCYYKRESLTMWQNDCLLFLTNSDSKKEMLL